jgi:hypothetical protein
MLGALDLNRLLLGLDNVVQTVQNVSDELSLNVGNLIGNLLDLIGDQETHLDWDLGNGGLLWELALGIELEDLVGVLGRKHDVTLMGRSPVGDSDIDNRTDLDDLKLTLVSFLIQFQVKFDRVLLSLNFDSNVVNLSVESDLDALQSLLEGLGNDLRLQTDTEVVSVVEEKVVNIDILWDGGGGSSGTSRFILGHYG